MKSFILLTFGFLGWAFFEMSGGTDFEPEVRTAKVEAPTIAEPAPTPEIIVTRASAKTASDLSPINKPLVDAIQASVIAASFTDAPAAAPKSAAEALALEAAKQAALRAQLTDIRSVSGSRVNMRQGPGTNYGVVATLTRGMETEVLEILNGWARIRVVENGNVGWMAERLLARTQG